MPYIVGEIYTLQDLKLSDSLLRKDFFPQTLSPRMSDTFQNTTWVVHTQCLRTEGFVAKQVLHKAFSSYHTVCKTCIIDEAMGNQINFYW